MITVQQEIPELDLGSKSFFQLSQQGVLRLWISGRQILTGSMLDNNEMIKAMQPEISCHRIFQDIIFAKRLTWIVVINVICIRPYVSNDTGFTYFPIFIISIFKSLRWKMGIVFYIRFQ